MKSINKVTLIGHLGKDPELRYTTSGVAVATFSLATGEKWKDGDGEWQERTEWHNIVAWKKLAEVCAEYLKKGSPVYVEGRIQTRSWEDKGDGKKRYMTEIVISELVMLGGKGESQSADGGKPKSAKTAKKEDGDDLPF